MVHKHLGTLLSPPPTSPGVLYLGPRMQTRVTRIASRPSASVLVTLSVSHRLKYLLPESNIAHRPLYGIS